MFHKLRMGRLSLVLPSRRTLVAAKTKRKRFPGTSRRVLEVNRRVLCNALSQAFDSWLIRELIRDSRMGCVTFKEISCSARNRSTPRAQLRLR